MATMRELIEADIATLKTEIEGRQALVAEAEAKLLHFGQWIELEAAKAKEEIQKFFADHSVF